MCFFKMILSPRGLAKPTPGWITTYAPVGVPHTSYLIFLRTGRCPTHQLFNILHSLKCVISILKVLPHFCCRGNIYPGTSYYCIAFCVLKNFHCLCYLTRSNLILRCYYVTPVGFSIGGLNTVVCYQNCTPASSLFYDRVSLPGL